MAEPNNVDKSVETNEPFSGLGLSVGCHFTIETLSSSRKYQVQLLGYWDKRSIIISPPLRDGREVLLDKDTPLAVRLLVGKKVCAFETKVIYRSSHPYNHYHLFFPESVNTRQIRNSERVDTSIEVSLDSDFDIMGDWPRLATISNLSKTGACLSSSTSLGEKGHELVMMFELFVSGMKKQLRIPCLIRNIQLSPGQALKEQDSAGGRYVVGIQFLEMDDEHRLSLSSYIYEHQHH